MSMRTLTILLAGVALLLSVSYVARTYLARQHCEDIGRTYQPGRGCVEPPAAPAIIIERGLTRT